MSDDWIAIPRNAEKKGDPDALNSALEYFKQIAIDTEEFEIINQSTYRFFHCGANLETINCTCCGVSTDIDWWMNQLSDCSSDDGDFFLLKPLKTPCCNVDCTLNDFEYNFDQGVSKWG